MIDFASPASVLQTKRIGVASPDLPSQWAWPSGCAKALSPLGICIWSQQDLQSLPGA